jgi:putative ABC transport system permease protein
MNAFTFLVRNLRYYARSHAGTLLGAVIASAILTGALMVGDSVRESLFEMANARLGRIDTVITGNDRLFRSALASDLKTASFPGSTAALQLPAVASSPEREARANQTRLIGVESAFWDLALKPRPEVHPSKDEVTLSQSLAKQLKAGPGETLILRVQKPSRLSPDAPLAPEEDNSLALRLKIAHVVEDQAMGRFSLQASQLPALNAFVDLGFLQEKLEIPGRANLLLLSQAAGTSDQPTNGKGAMEALQEHWTLEDSQLTWQNLNEVAGKGMELRSDRIFMDEISAKAAVQASEKGMGILTYFVNTIRKGTHSTPYSMVTATGAPYVPPDLGPDEIIITQWLADDLQAKVGDTVDMTYYTVGVGRTLQEATATFTVDRIVAMEGIHADPTLMPDFPGLKDADNCRDWDTGFPIDLDLVREKDNTYWETYKGMPKAFISLATGMKLWKNRFGSLTAVRYPDMVDETKRIQLTQQIQERIAPSKLGVVAIPVQEQAKASVMESQDFSGLFIGFSFFLIAAAMILMNLLFQFVMEQRVHEAGILMAVGMTPRRLKQFLLREGVLLSLVGSLLGAVLAVLYAKGMLYGLSTIWREAVGTSSLTFHFNPRTLLNGIVGSVAMAGVTLWWGLRKQIQKPAHILLTEGQIEGQSTQATGTGHGFIIGAGCSLAALGLAYFAQGSEPAQAAGSFFGAGALLLAAGLFTASALLGRLQQATVNHAPNLTQWGVRNASRRKKRSLATISMLAFGTFMIIAVGANKLDALRDTGKRSSGTGGFSFWGESSQAVVKDLNGAEGIEAFGLFPDALKDVHFVQLRLREGEDASCLNLNRAQRPRLLGVNPDELASRKAFTFAQVWNQLPTETSPWEILHEVEPDGTIPGIADVNSIMWAMGKSVGDILLYQNARGETFRVRLVAGVANSILQGSIIISESAFVDQFPHEPGYRLFLIDTLKEDKLAVSKKLTRAMADIGLSLQDTVDRMNAFNAVQNTYLSTFQLMGGLGMILGSFGMGAVVLRNLLDRRTELGLLGAVGFTKQRISALVLVEHLGLLVYGLLIGAVSAWVAVIPSLQSPGIEIPYQSLAITLITIFMTGFAWTWLASRSALKGTFLDALRNQ